MKSSKVTNNEFSKKFQNDYTQSDKFRIAKKLLGQLLPMHKPTAEEIGEFI